MASRKPGGRHSNDHANYRLIAALPTVDEAVCKDTPFLPTPRDEWPMLDRLFRLLREDMVSALREVISTLAPEGGQETEAQVVAIRERDAARLRPDRPRRAQFQGVLHAA